LNAAGGFARGLHGGQEQGDEDGDDGDDYQQFDERESSASHGCSPAVLVRTFQWGA
jgi:hypothetical protein